MRGAVVEPSSTLTSEDRQSKISARNVMLAAKGGGITFVGQLFVYGSRFIIALIVARLLEAGQYGLFNLGLTAVEIFTQLASLGMAAAAIRHISHFVAKRDEAGVWGSIQVVFGLTTLMSLIMAVFMFALADPIAVQLFNEPRLAPILRLVSFFVPFFSLSDMAAASTRGFKNMKYTVLAQNIAQPIFRLALIAGVALLFGLNAWWALVAAGITEFFVASLLVFFLNRLFPLRRPLNTGRREIKRMLTFSLPVYGSNMINRIGGNIKTVLLGMFGTVRTVGIFGIVSQVTLLADMFQQSVGLVAQPIISDLYSRDDRKELGRMYQIMTRWSVTVNLPLFLILVLFPNPILSLFGKSFVEGALALSISAWRGFVDIATGICGIMIDMTDNTRLKLVNTVISLAVSIGLAILLIPTWGLVGAATAALSSEIVINLLRLIEVYVLLRLLPYNASFFKPLIAGALGIGAVWLTERIIPSDAGLVFLGLNIAVLFIVYIAATAAMGLTPEDRIILTRIKDRLSAKRRG